MKRFIPVLFSLLFCQFLGAQVYVSSTASGNNDGSSWQNAYTELYTAVTNAPASAQIWVASGIYLAGPNDSTWIYPLANLELYGGFNGNETQLSQRDVESNRTTISGDVMGDDVPGLFDMNRTDNNRHLIWLDTFITNSTVIDGFTFSGGQTIGEGGGGDDRRGGAILSYGGPIIRNCTFRDNFGWFGGAIYPRFQDASNFRLEDCTFFGNYGGAGGALYINSITNGVFKNLAFQGNISENSGGAVYHQASSCIWEDCTFTSNACGLDSRAGALYNTNSALTMMDCTFELNDSPRTGGAIHNTHSDGNVNTSLFQRCEFNENTCSGWGGAMTSYNAGTNITIEYCTFRGNTCSRSGAAMSAGFEVEVNILNSLFEENQATESGGAIFNQNENTTLISSNNRYIANTAGSVGGAINSGSGQLTFISEDYFESNSASTSGGAIAANEDTMDLSILLIENTTMLANIAGNQGGAINLSNTDAIVFNSLIAFNFADGAGTGGGVSNNVGGGDADTIGFVNTTFANNFGELAGGIAQWTDSDTSNAAMVLWNSIHANDTDNYTIEDGSPTIISIGGNLSSDGSLDSYFTETNDENSRDPLFVDPTEFNYELSENSPCIDSGVDGPDIPETDLNGNPRVGVVDKGCYEYQGSVSVEENVAKELLSITMQNPIRSEMMLSLSGSLRGNIDAQLVNMTGHQIHSFQLDKSGDQVMHIQDVSSFATGMYMLVLSQENKRLITKQLVIINR